jgi:mRNA-degrading endonuclease RelE of RelBE toxin-antitoxin system
MRHFASPSFWECYRNLPSSIQELADKNFELLESNPQHPSLHLKKVGKYWSARVGRKYRALAVEIEEGVLWFWIGTHAEYDKLVQ